MTNIEQVSSVKKPAKFVLSYVTQFAQLERVEAHHTWDLCYEHGKKWMDPLYCQGYVLTPLDPKLNVFL